MDYMDMPFWILGDDGEGQELFDRFEEATVDGGEFFMDRDDYISLSAYCLRGMDIHDAERVIASAMHFYPNDVSFKAYLAYCYVVMGNTSKAESILQAMDRVNIGSEMIVIGDVYRAMKKYEEGIAWFDRILEGESDSDLKGYAMMGISEMYSLLGDYDKSLDYMKHVFEGEGEDIETADLLVATFVEPDKVDEGIEYFRGYVDDNPYSAIGWMSLGRLYNEESRNEEAIESLDYAIAIDDKFAMPYFFKGCVLTDMGDIDDAIRHFNIVMEYDLNEDKNFSVFYNLGRCYVLKVDTSEAMVYFLKAIDAGVPEDENSIYIECAKIMTLDDKPAEALKYIQKAIELEPDNVSFLIAKAEWYFRRGEIDDSIVILKRVIELDKSHPLPFIKLADMYEMIEEYNDAIIVIMDGLDTCKYVPPLLYKLGAMVTAYVSDKKGILLLKKAYELAPDGIAEVLELYPGIAKLVKKKLKLK